MSERTFRAVVATVLVGALALAVLVVVAALPRSSEPQPSTTTVPGPTITAAPTVGPTRVAGPAFMVPGVVSVGLVPQGATSGGTLVLQFVEPSVDAIPDAPGTFQVTLADHAGDGSTIAFVGTPSIDAPGSLGATAALVAPNVLQVSILASDTVNIEPITITGLGIRASSNAAIGPIEASLDALSGSLATGAANNVLASPGSVVAGP